jgi:RNA-directed DNA polymerase
MRYWKQWRRPRTKIKNLVVPGGNFVTATKHGVSSHGYWHMARTSALQQALNSAWLKAQGLVSIRGLWIKAQGYSTKKRTSIRQRADSSMRTRTVVGMGVGG